MIQRWLRSVVVMAAVSCAPAGSRLMASDVDKATNLSGGQADVKTPAKQDETKPPSGQADLKTPAKQDETKPPSGQADVKTPVKQEETKSPPKVDEKQKARSQKLTAKALQRLEKDDLEGADEAVRKALEADPGNTQAPLLLTEICLRRGDFRQAQIWAEEARKVDPASEFAVRMEARVLIAMGRHSEAIDLYRQAVALDPKSAAPLLELGLAYKEAERLEEAAAAYGMALELEPRNADGHFYLGVVQVARNETDAALKSFLTAAALSPDDVEPTFNAGQLYYNQGKFAEARAQWLKVHAQAPSSLEALKKIIQSFYAEEKYADAEPYRAKILKLQRTSKDPEIRKTKSYCMDQFKAGDLQVLVYEIFDKTGDLFYVYTFRAYDAKGTFVKSVNLESSAVIRELGMAYILGSDAPGGVHRTFGSGYAELPPYGELKKVAVELLTTERPAAASSAPAGGPGK